MEITVTDMEMVSDGGDKADVELVDRNVRRGKVEEEFRANGGAVEGGGRRPSWELF